MSGARNVVTKILTDDEPHAVCAHALLWPLSKPCHWWHNQESQGNEILFEGYL